MSIIQAVLAILKAIPILDSWFERLAAAYVASRIQTMRAENRDAIKKAVEAHDTIDLEKAVGNPEPGAPSGIPGTVVRDKLPGA